jgi:hypothetical protein
VANVEVVTRAVHRSDTIDAVMRFVPRARLRYQLRQPMSVTIYEVGQGVHSQLGFVTRVTDVRTE